MAADDDEKERTLPCAHVRQCLIQKFAVTDEMKILIFPFLCESFLGRKSARMECPEFISSNYSLLLSCSAELLRCLCGQKGRVLCFGLSHNASDSIEVFSLG